MARHEHIDTSPLFLAAGRERQLLLGTFEHALHHLLERVIDLSAFDSRFNNNLVGASAKPQAMLLIVVLFAYTQRLVRSRGTSATCRERVTFICRAPTQ